MFQLLSIAVNVFLILWTFDRIYTHKIINSTAIICIILLTTNTNNNIITSSRLLEILNGYF